MAFLAWWFWPARSWAQPGSPTASRRARGDLADEEKTNIAIYQQAAPAVVHVTNLFQLRNGFSLDLQQIPKRDRFRIRLGRGRAYRDELPRRQGADAAKVILADHSAYDARKVWAYPDKDIAVLWINAPKSKLRPILIGTSHDLKVGQVTFAIGNPFGLDQTMTTGIVERVGP